MKKNYIYHKQITAFILTVCLLAAENMSVLAVSNNTNQKINTIKINENEVYPLKHKATEKINIYNKNIAEIDKSGNLIGINQGNTKLLIRSENNRQLINVKVIKPEINAKNENVILYHGTDEKYSTKYTLKPVIKGVNKTFSILDFDKNIINIDSRNQITPLKAGNTSLTISANGISKKVNITVKENKITLNKNNIILSNCKNNASISNEQLTVTNIIGKNKKIIWSTSDKNVCTIKNGKVSAVSPGEATVTASANGVSASCNVTILPENVLFASVNECIYEGNNYTINSNKDNNVYISSSSNIVSVESDNRLYARSNGECTIFVENNGEKYSFNVKVNSIVTSIKATACYFKTKKNNLKYALDYTVSGPTNDHKFSSSNSEIANVDNNGVLTIKNSGSCDITLFANNIESKSKIVVEKNNNEFELKYKKYHLYTGTGNKLILNTIPKVNNVKFSSLQPEIATVNEKGIVTAISPGYAVIKANCDGIERECFVTVEETSILFDRNVTFVKPNDKKCIPFDVIGYNHNPKYKIKDKKIATIKNGIITGKNTGETYVTIKANGIEKSHKIVVGDCSHEFDETVLKDNTCNTKGYIKYVCKICGFTYEDETDFNINNHKDELISNIAVPATCEYEGKEVLSCKSCGAITAENNIPRLDHKYEWIEDNGICIKRCSVCKKIINIKPIGMPEKPSILDPLDKIVITPEKPIIIDNNNPDFHIHFLGEWITDVIPTCKTKGIKYRICDCGFSEYTSIDESDHCYGIDFKCKYCDKYKAGFYDNTGNMIIAYEDANMDISKDFEVCNLINECSKDVICKSESGKYICYKYENNKIELLNIPNDHILSVLSRHPEITKIVIPDNISIIGDNALAFLNNIKYIVLPDSIKSIKKGAFRSCTNLIQINIPESIETIEDDAFNNDKELEQFIYQNTTISTTKELFELINKLNVKIGNSVFSGSKNFNNHNFSDYIIDLNPTCINPGGMHRYCNDKECKYREETIINPLGHEYNDFTVDISANCVSSGYKSRKCVRCKDVKDLTIIEPKGHVESEYIITQYPNCENDGTKIKKCLLCDEILDTKVIEKLNHNFIEDDVVASTCTEFGNMHYICNRNGCTARKDVAISPKGHKALPSVSENVILPKCLNSGREDIVIYCGTCDAEISRKTKIIPALGHQYCNEFTVDIIPTCTKNGSKSRHCIRENDEYYDCRSKTDIMDVEPLGHDYSKISKRVKIHATCTESGLNYYDCSRCNNTDNDYFTYIVPALGHNYNEDFSIDLSPTCTRTGSKSRHCSQCYESTDITEIPIIPHDYSLESNRICVYPTCLSNGSNYYDCIVCGNSENTNKAITYATPALGHNHSEQFTVDILPTCTMSGLKSKHCLRSGCESKIELTSIPVADHIEVNAGTQSAHTKCGECSVTLSTQHTYSAKIKTNATCTVKGTHTYTCSCGYSYDSQDIAATGHTEINGGTASVHKKCKNCGITLSTSHSYSSSVKAAATCTAKGTHTYTCSCGYSYDSQDIAALGHSETNGGTSAVHKKCSRCGATLSTQHSYSSKVKTNATCTVKGTHTYTCACGYSYDSQDIPATGHTEINGGTAAVHKKCKTCGTTLSSIHIYTSSVKTAATCTVKGTHTYTCACDYSYNKQDIPATGHNPYPFYLDNTYKKCMTCGYEWLNK